MGLIIRRASIADLRPLSVVEARAFLQEQGEENEEKLEALSQQFFHYYEGILRENDNIVYIAFENGHAEDIVGIGGISFYKVMPTHNRITGMRSHITNIFTRSDYRGKGIASALLDRLVEEANKRGVDYITLDTNDESRKLFENYGFEEMPNALALKLK